MVGDANAVMQDGSSGSGDASKRSQVASLTDDGGNTGTTRIRPIKAGQKIRRISGLKQAQAYSTNEPPSKEQQERHRRASSPRKLETSGSSGRNELAQTASDHRSKNSHRTSSTAMRGDPYASPTQDSSSVSTHESSMGSQPPPEKEIRISPGSLRRVSLTSADVGSPSLHRSFTSLSFASMDLSRHGALPVYDPITTSATGEQWARFKLLGRTGLGDVQLSDEAYVLVERNFNIMLRAIKHIYALRDGDNDDASVESVDAENVLDIRTGHLLEEVQETIHVPAEGPARLKRDPETIVVKDEIQAQLKDYISVIASMYRDNAFHAFQHASTVLQAVDKLIKLVKRPEDNVDYKDLKHGYGVATEPWNHFALVFSALIHDVDHNGVPNAQLIKEQADVAGAYKNRSVAEQNSIELAWNLLMEPCYKELRESVFLFRSEMSNFRSLVVTAVLATDIADKELKALRNGRAAEALKAEEKDEEANMDLVSRKATFVVETLIQVADVSHTMSSFDDYKQWNHRLYKEMYAAYRNGRADSDPTDTWYKGEFGFFDYYIIPLAKKLMDCGISEEACNEYVNNAKKNRKIWEKRGEKLVEGFVEERRAEDEEMMRTLSLHDMAMDTSSSESDGDGFAFDMDDVQIFSYKEVPALAREPSMDDHEPIQGKIPSKASGDSSRHTRTIVFLSQSSGLAADEPVSPSSSKRSWSSASASKTRSRSNSPSSSVDRSTKSAKKSSRSRSKSPASRREGSLLVQKKAKMRGRKPTRSVSPGSAADTSVERVPGTTKATRKGKRSPSASDRSPSASPGSASRSTKPKVGIQMKSRSRSPANGADEATPVKQKMRGRRPQRSVSPGSGTESQSKADGDEDQGKATTRKGKRPSRTKSREGSKSPGSPSLNAKPKLQMKVRDRSKSPGDVNEKAKSKTKRSSSREQTQSRSVSPGSSTEMPTEKKPKRKTKEKKLRKGRRPSRSKSPLGDPVDKSEPLSAGKTIKKKKKKKSLKSKGDKDQKEVKFTASRAFAWLSSMSSRR